MKEIIRQEGTEQEQRTRYLVLTAVFAAITFMAIRINIPIGIGGHVVHVGDSMIYLAACILPTPYAMAAGSIGAALSDFTTPGCMVYVIPTLIIKAVMAGYFTNQGKILCKRNVVASIVAGVTGLIGYYIADIFITGSFVAGLSAIIGQLPQLVGSMVVFLAVGMAMDKAKIRSRLSLR